LQYPQVIADTGGQNGRSEYYRRAVAAMQQLTDAETARAHRDPREAACWRHAAERCLHADLPWDQAYCHWREVRALVRGRTATRRDTATALRRAYKIAVDLQAQPVLADLVALARTARIPLLAKPRPSPATDDSLPGLTSREREVLTYLVAGWTYAEIARELVLSEKTISTHVSNMLRKTGTANRVELAQRLRPLSGEISNQPG
jgi:DNA-binding CsgD family transcriptional regulator